MFSRLTNVLDSNLRSNVSASSLQDARELVSVSRSVNIDTSLIANASADGSCCCNSRQVFIIRGSTNVSRDNLTIFPASRKTRSSILHTWVSPAEPRRKRSTQAVSVAERCAYSVFHSRHAARAARRLSHISTSSANCFSSLPSGSFACKDKARMRCSRVRQMPCHEAGQSLSKILTKRSFTSEKRLRIGSTRLFVCCSISFSSLSLRWSRG